MVPNAFDIFIFLVFIWGFRIIGLAINTKLLDKFADKGYSLSSSVGMIVTAYTLWIAALIFRIPLSQTTSLIFFIGLLVTSVIYLLKNKSQFTGEFPRLTIQFIEIFYLTVFFLFIIYRNYLPEINVVEDVMDFGIINSIIRGDSLPPQDVWYSGTPTNYYYFGQFIVGIMGKLTGIQSSILYNIYISHLVATIFISIFGIAFTICNKYFFALFSALLMIVGGNLSMLKHYLFDNKKDYFYADARSLIPNTINEFPSYSFIISNLHAHILGLMNVTVFIGILISILKDRTVLRSKFFVIISSLILGSLLITNSWDFVIYVPLLILVSSIGGLNETKFRQMIPTIIKNGLFGIMIGILSIILVSPFFATFYNPTKGIGIVHDILDPIAICIMFGYFFWILSIGIIFYKNITNKLIILLLSAYGLLLIFIPGVFFLKDIYYELNPSYYRANTIFKVWYQAWTILTLVSGPILYSLFLQILKWKSKYLVLQSLIGFIFLGFFVFYYPIDSYKYRIGTNEIKGLEGDAYLENNDPGKYFIITWLNSEARAQTTIVEGYGKSYSLDSIVSAYTGHPTIVGWYEHELGWRNNWPEIANRMGEVKKIYTSPNILEVKAILKKYQVKYIIISSNERELFGDSAGENLSQITQTIASYDNDKILLVTN